MFLSNSLSTVPLLCYVYILSKERGYAEGREAVSRHLLARLSCLTKPRVSRPSSRIQKTLLPAQGSHGVQYTLL